MLVNLMQQLQAGIDQLGLTIAIDIQKQMLGYLELLQQWNKAMNLTAVKGTKQQIKLHLLDSLAVTPYLSGNRIVDVGTGAGLPGIPLALTNPALSVTLLDASKKRTLFLTQAVHELNITNVDIHQVRVESFTVSPGFDSIVTRAFSSLTQMIAKTQHLLVPGGRFLAMKGQLPVAELTELDQQQWSSDVYALTVPGLAQQRHAIVITAKEQNVD